MKNLLLFTAFLLVFTCGKLSAQYNQKLYNKLTEDLDRSRSNAQKIKALLALGDYHVEQSYMAGYLKSIDTAFVYAKKSEDMAIAIKSKTYLADTYLLYSKAYNYISDYKNSIDFANKAIAVFNDAKDDKGVCRANRTLFRALRYLDNRPDLTKLTGDNVKLAFKTKDNYLIGMAYEDLALANIYGTGDETRVLEPFNLSLKYYKAAGKYDLQHIYSLQAGIYCYFSEQEKAMKCTIEAIRLANKFNDTSYDMIALYGNAGRTYKDIERYDIAEKYYTKAYAIANRYIDPEASLNIAVNLKDVLKYVGQKNRELAIVKDIEKLYPLCSPSGQLTAFATLIMHYLNSNDFKTAKKYYEKTEPLIPYAEGDSAAAASITPALTNYYYITGQYKLSQKYIDLYNSSVTDAAIHSRPFVNTVQFLLDSVQGKYLMAIKDLQVVQAYEDSMFNETKHRQINELEIKHSVEQNKKDNLLLKKKAELQQSQLSHTELIRNISFTGILLLAIIVFLVYRKYFITQRLRKVISSKNAKLEILLTEKENLLEEKEWLLEEKEWLLKEIHHRVKNNLQVVMSLLNTQSYFLNDAAAKEAIKNSQHRIHSMSLIHKKLYQSDSIVSVNMADYFWELIEYYKIAFDTDNCIKFDLNIEPVELDSAQAVPIGLILNEAINNALKHAFPHGKGTIAIHVETLPDNRIKLVIEDNGVGFAGDIATFSFSSLGMKLIKGFCGELSADLSFTNHSGLGIIIIFTNNMKTPENTHAAATEEQLTA